MMFSFGATVTRLRAKLIKDRNGDLVEDWANPDKLVISKVGVAPSVTSEDNAIGRNTVLDGRTLYLTSITVDIKANDRFYLPEGGLWVVDGSPQVWQQPMTGWRAGQVIMLKRLEARP